jgi:glycosyltransferase involved in cell wall biosynthesis
MIKVSVIIPVYKVPLEYLQACFDSLAAQTMHECEFIVVSDGAPDEECSICEKYVAKDSKFKFFKREHAGVSATRNYGIDQAQGEYIAFVDADDWIDPETNQIVYDYAFENDSDIVFWDMVKEYPTSSEKKENWNNQNVANINKKEMSSILTNLVHLQKLNIARACLAKLYRKKFISSNNLKFCSDLYIGEDYLFNIQAIHQSKKNSYVSTISYHYRQNNTSATHSYHPYVWENIKKYEKEVKSFIPTSLYNRWATDVVMAFFWSLSLDYFNPQNKEKTSQKIKEMRNIVKSTFFQEAIRSTDWSVLSPIMKIKVAVLKFFPSVSLFLATIKNCKFNKIKERV